MATVTGRSHIPDMVRIAISQAAFDAIAATLVLGTVAVEPERAENGDIYIKAKALNRQEFVIAGWSDPEGSRPYLGALLLGYYTDDGKLTYAGRVGTGMPVKVLADLRRRLDLLARKTSPLSAPPPRSTRFGSPLVLSRVHWVEPKLGSGPIKVLARGRIG